MKTNIPQYRAKKIDSDEYVEGYYVYLKRYKKHYLINTFSFEQYNLKRWEIEPSTLSISFPDMLDKNNKRIFASLSEDGKGGDIIKHPNLPEEFTAIMQNGTFSFSEHGCDWIGTISEKDLLKCEVTGIYEGDSNE